MDYYIGMLGVFGFDWAPKGFLTCQGQTLPIQQNAALYTLLGIQYGGDGKVTFLLPDMRGRMILGQGTAPGSGTYYGVGHNGGQSSNTFTTSQMPAHIHGATASLAVSTTNGSKDAAAAGDYLGVVALGRTQYTAYVPSNNPGTTVALGGTSVTVAASGDSQPVNTMSPYLVLNPCICTWGTYPSRE